VLALFQVEYHRDYEASKGNVISVAEDPEMSRIKQVANVISQASYSSTRNRDSDPGKLNVFFQRVGNCMLLEIEN
jgi:hypothetical protein